MSLIPLLYRFGLGRCLLVCLLLATGLAKAFGGYGQFSVAADYALALAVLWFFSDWFAAWWAKR